jgi:hypothetical protein
MNLCNLPRTSQKTIWNESHWNSIQLFAWSFQHLQFRILQVLMNSPPLPDSSLHQCTCS